MNLSDLEKDFFIRTIKGHRHYLEYGSGWTTGVAKQHCDVTSIETDPQWAVKTDATHVHMGQVGSWGYPLSPSVEQLNTYFSFAREAIYDILMIDGRYRVGVAYYSRPCIFMVHDYNREEYQVIETFAKKLDQVETLALFSKEKRSLVDVLNPI